MYIIVHLICDHINNINVYFFILKYKKTYYL